MAPKTPFSLNALSRALALFALAAGALQASAAGTSFEYKKLTRTLVVTSPSTSSSTSGNTGNSGAPTTPVAPTLTGDLSTHSLAFDAKAVGTSQTKSLLLSNTGTGPLPSEPRLSLTLASQLQRPARRPWPSVPIARQT